mmetsp:Transcript_11015/g.18042  ORF Transcript_11015/g.18042 Transcript_11015/m.18042 type:complete len:394 (+) Transcript_11015:98-1279(+)
MSGVDRTVACFWDIENLQVPVDVDAALLGTAIQSLCRSLSSVQNLEFVNAYIDTAQLGTRNSNKLSQIGLNLIHSPNSKEMADKTIILDLLLWLLIFERNSGGGRLGDTRPEPCVVLISQDHDFEPMLHKLRNQRGIHVVLVTDFNSVQPHFMNAASESFDWREVIEEARRLEKTPSRAGNRSPVRAPREGDNARLAKSIEGSRESIDSQGTTSSASSGRSLKKRYSSVVHFRGTVEDQIADFTLTTLTAAKGGKITSDILLSLMKNPATGGSFEMYNVASRDFGKNIDIILEKYPDRFELSLSKRSRKTWVTLIGSNHAYKCSDNIPQEMAQESRTNDGMKTLTKRHSQWGAVPAIVENQDGPSPASSPSSAWGQQPKASFAEMLRHQQQGR